MDQHHGIVYLADDPDAHPPFRGYWENARPPAMPEDGPRWADAAEAIRWGRARAAVVLIRLWPDRDFSAGTDTPIGEDLPVWPDQTR